MLPDLSIQLLRSMIAVHDAGSLAAAAERLGRTESAVSLQMSRLEQQTGMALFARKGRRLVLTPQGQLLLGHARAIVNRVDAARAALMQTAASGSVRLGLVQDFAGAFLTETLRILAAQFPGIRVEVIVDRSAVLLERLGAGKLDVALCSQPAATPAVDIVEPMVWFGRADLCEQDVLPLAVVTSPCPFLDAAISALDLQQRPWRIAFETPSLDGLRAAVAAGLGIGCRTAWVSGDRQILDARHGLPDLPMARWALRRRKDAGEASGAVVEIIRERIAAPSPP